MKNGKKNKNNGSGVNSQTKIEHAGYKPELSEGAVDIPIMRSTTYEFESAEAGKEAFIKALSGESLSNLIYSRVNHPNAEILENRLVFMEPGAGEAAVFSSGMSAIVSSVMALCPSDKVIAFTGPLYGGTYHFFNGVLKAMFGYRLVELSSDTEIAYQQISRIGYELGLLYIETPANPTLHMTDIDALATAAKNANHESYVFLDNTFMGIFQHGFEISGHLDLIIYSGTKFIGGHSDVLNGVAICHKQNRDIMKKIKGLRIILGTILHPYECSQVVTHLNTYELRMTKQAENAKIIAGRIKALESKKIKKILYPDFFEKGTAEYDIYHMQCSGGSSIICFWLNCFDEAGAFRFLNELKKSGIVSLAVSLGGLETLASHPKSTTHSEMEEDVLERLGITDNLVRFSVGLENPDDLCAAIINALKVV